jgi:hypothetical protein
LLPQLTDLLYALTKSQELLVHKLQSLRLEHDEHLSGNESPHSETSPDAVRRGLTLVQLTRPATSDDGDASTTREIEEAARLAAMRLGPTQFDSDDHVAAGSAQTVDTWSTVDAATQRRPETEAFVPPRYPVDAAAPTDAAIPRAEKPGAPTDEATERNYNFFDELDLKLNNLETDPGER